MLLQCSRRFFKDLLRGFSVDDLSSDVVVFLFHEILFRQGGLVGHELDPVGFDVLLHVVPLDKPPKLKYI